MKAIKPVWRRADARMDEAMPVTGVVKPVEWRMPMPQIVCTLKVDVSDFVPRSE